MTKKEANNKIGSIKAQNTVHQATINLKCVEIKKLRQKIADNEVIIEDLENHILFD